MIPLGDEGTPAQRGLPIVNLALIAINILVFLLQLSTGLENGPITMGWSLVPEEIRTGRDLIGPNFLQGLDYAQAPLDVHARRLAPYRFQHALPLHLRR
jgi:membrane associated rhomboid family serine protease